MKIKGCYLTYLGERCELGEEINHTVIVDSLFTVQCADVTEESCSHSINLEPHSQNEYRLHEKPSPTC